MPRSLWFKVLLCWPPSGRRLVRPTPDGSRFRRRSAKSEKDTRQYQAIRLDNDMVVLLVSDPQAVKSLSALVVPVGSLQDPADHQGLAHFLEHMTLMGSQNIPSLTALQSFLNCTAAAITPAPRLTAPRFISKWKMMRWTGP